MLAPSLEEALLSKPRELTNVPDTTWSRLVEAHRSQTHETSFRGAFANGRAFLAARDGLRGRRPLIAEWKGPHQLPSDDATPIDLRIDHVYLVSCKYRSRVLHNASPARLFESLLGGEERSRHNWFSLTAPSEYERFYNRVISTAGLVDMPATPDRLTAGQQTVLNAALSERALPAELRTDWLRLSTSVAHESARRWRLAITSDRVALRLLWRLLRIGGATYFVLGTDRNDSVRIRVASAWDWHQAFHLQDLAIAPRAAGQSEVGWSAQVRRRSDSQLQEVAGHVQIRWSHGRFKGVPEAKVYLDTPHELVPGYFSLA